MYTQTSFTVEIGRFGIKFRSNDVVIGPSELKLPLVQNTLVGLAETGTEQGYCDGSAIASHNIEATTGGDVFYVPRASYDGKKIILPLDTQSLSAEWIGTKHGELRRSDDGESFVYFHQSEKGNKTHLWFPGKGTDKKAKNRGDVILLRFNDEVKELYLLLGGTDLSDPEEVRQYVALGTSARELKRFPLYYTFPMWSFYVKVARETPEESVTYEQGRRNIGDIVAGLFSRLRASS